MLGAALRALGWSPSTQARALTAAREWLAPYFPPGRSPPNGSSVRRSVPPLIPRLSQADAQSLVESADAAPAPAQGVRGALELRDRAVLEVLYGSALRRQELCDLELAGLDFEHETVRVVGKGRQGPNRAADRARGRGAGRRGCAMAVPWSSIERRPCAARSSCRCADAHSTAARSIASSHRGCVRWGAPGARTCCATRPRPICWRDTTTQEGAHLRVVQEVLGHASLATTQRYTGVTTKDIQRQLRRGHPRG